MSVCFLIYSFSHVSKRNLPNKIENGNVLETFFLNEKKG